MEIYECNDALLHAKKRPSWTAWAALGSSNMDWQSFTLNHEIDAVVLGDRLAGQMENLVRIDRAAARPITREQWNDRDTALRFMAFWGCVFERAL